MTFLQKPYNELQCIANKLNVARSGDLLVCFSRVSHMTVIIFLANSLCQGFELSLVLVVDVKDDWDQELVSSAFRCTK